MNTFVILKKGSNLAAVNRNFAKSYNKNAAQELKEQAEKYDYKINAIPASTIIGYAISIKNTK